jgi:hypothetical protein
MPIKYNLTWADMLSTKIHKTAIKSPPAEGEDRKTMLIGVIVAALSSSHSWQTYKAVKENPTWLGKPEVKDEYLKALEDGWRNITYTDINEIAQDKNVENAFDTWLVFNVEKKEHEDYREAWKYLIEQSANSCDDVKREEEGP